MNETSSKKDQAGNQITVHNPRQRQLNKITQEETQKNSISSIQKNRPLLFGNDMANADLKAAGNNTP